MMLKYNNTNLYFQGQQESCKSEGVQTSGAKTTSTTGTCTPRMSSKDYSEGYVETDLFKPPTVTKTSRNPNKTYREDYRYRDSKLLRHYGVLLLIKYVSGIRMIKVGDTFNFKVVYSHFYRTVFMLKLRVNNKKLWRTLIIFFYIIFNLLCSKMNALDFCAYLSMIF